MKNIANRDPSLWWGLEEWYKCKYFLLLSLSFLLPYIYRGYNFEFDENKMLLKTMHCIAIVHICTICIGLKDNMVFGFTFTLWDWLDEFWNQPKRSLYDFHESRLFLYLAVAWLEAARACCHSAQPGRHSCSPSPAIVRSHQTLTAHLQKLTFPHAACSPKTKTVLQIQTETRSSSSG